jgi:uncharacterized membrane protein
MEVLAISSFCFTLLFGGALLFLFFRLYFVRRDLLRRIQTLEADLVNLRSGVSLPDLTGADATASQPVVAAKQPAVPMPAVASTSAPQPSLAVAPTATFTGSEPLRTETVTTPATASSSSSTGRPFALPAPVTWFLRRHLLVQIGVGILFIGVAFLLKYAADQGWFSLELRHISAAVGGLALAGAGWAVRKRAPTYALALQGGGLGIVYLTAFFAFRVYELIPGGLAFVIFVVLGAACAALAVVNDARILALLAVVGAFLAPLLASTGEGSHVALFGYYVLVSAVVFAIGWFKAWRSLNVASFLLTLAGAVAWGSSAYESALFASTQPFLALFFFFYLAIAILYALRRTAEQTPDERPDPVDVALVFGNPLVVLLLQAALVGHIAYALAASALAMGGVYGVVAAFFWRRRPVSPPLLAEAFLFLSFFFLALSVPLFFDRQITAAVWAVAGAGWVWMGVGRQRTWTVGWGILVQLGAGLAQLGVRTELNGAALPALSLVFVGAYLVGAAGLFSAYHVRRWLAPGWAGRTALFVARGLAIWGALWWYGGGTDHLLSSAPRSNVMASLVIFYALSGVLGEWIGTRLVWQGLRAPLAYFLPLWLLLAVLQLAEAPHHFVGAGLVAWPLVLVAHYWMVQRHESDAARPARWQAVRHAGALWLLAFLLTWLTGWATNMWTGSDTWTTAAVLVVGALFILLASEWGTQLPPLFARYARAYQTWGAGLLVVAVLLWGLLFRIDVAGGVGLLPYIPLLNPLDLAYLFVLGVLFRWVGSLRLAEPLRLYIPWGVVAFLSLNLAIARGVHQLADVPFTWPELYGSALLQTLYAIVWSVLALVLMFGATRRRVRAVWLFGAGILALTILKLFLVDLANANTIARIVSFIGVGVLVIVIAYFAPAPAGAATLPPVVTVEE